MYISHGQTHLGKPINEITAQDLIAFFSEERDESLTLEFKSYDVRSDRSYDYILRAITAFLNSEGGLLVFGAPSEVKKKGNYRVVKGLPTPIPVSFTTKDDLVRSMSSNISYMPVGIRVEPIAFPNDEFVYLIEVQESSNKPHQFNCQYPIRLDGQSIGAPHYLVESFFYQVTRPELNGYLRVVSWKFQISTDESPNKFIIGFQVSIFNNSQTANDKGVFIKLWADTGVFGFDDDDRYKYNSTANRFIFYDANSLITNGLPMQIKFIYEATTREINDLEEGPLKINIVFGSTNSITKISSYDLFLQRPNNFSPSDYTRTYIRIKDLNSLMEIAKEENVILTDVYDSLDDEQIGVDIDGI